ncbi:hypothetical protein [Bacillus cereus]|uniref:hypothetical protein n=1 Tax=Bacillus cereus TaxID=1396 RepID=UPI000BF4F7B7|nr:hypothetical protein [Bacillus cereus]PFM32266.1 hypothetical protein COJ47_13510 [Bacillus cereus]
MAGNEEQMIQYLFNNRGSICLDHLGEISEIGNPVGEKVFNIVQDLESLKKMSKEDSSKKADVYINGVGVSIKQTGGSFSFNRLQRANLLKTFGMLNFSDPEGLLFKIDSEVNGFHNGNVEGRNRPWNSFFSETEFKSLLHFLMMEGSPNKGFSNDPAKLILEGPRTIVSPQSISVYTFEEYFDKYKEKFVIAIRRQWVGQKSKSENSRAKGLAKKTENAPWIFDSVVGQPTTGWDEVTPVSERRTVYFLMIEKVR